MNTPKMFIFLKNFLQIGFNCVIMLHASVQFTPVKRYEEIWNNAYNFICSRD